MAPPAPASAASAAISRRSSPARTSTWTSAAAISMRAFPLAPPLLPDGDELDDGPTPVRARAWPVTGERTSAEAAALASRAMACGVDQIMRPRPPTVLEDAPVAVLRDLLLERRA